MGRNQPSPLITLTTDYGSRDYYVAALKGVIAGIAPQARTVDVTHDLEPQNVTHGAFVLWQTLSWFPPGTIHVVVVDPGVGTSRRVLLARYRSQWIITPDNGLLTFLHRESAPESLNIVENRRYMLPRLTTTFHGRDIMAPAAAHLANGVPAHEFGRATNELHVLPFDTRAKVLTDKILGQIIYTDRFGTLVTNIRRDQIEGFARPAEALEVHVDGRRVGPIRSTFSDVPRGEVLALFGGGDLLEIAVNCGRAKDVLKLGEGGVEVRRGAGR